MCAHILFIYYLDGVEVVLQATYFSYTKHTTHTHCIQFLHVTYILYTPHTSSTRCIHLNHNRCM